MRRAALHNMGCKVNSYELDVIGQKLREKGFSIVPFEEKADVYIVNTCSVTNIADRKSRQMLHQAKKRNPEAVVVAVGCYVQTGKEQALADGAVDLLIGNNRKKDTAEILEEFLKNQKKIGREWEEGKAEGKNSRGLSGEKCAEKMSAGRNAPDIEGEPTGEERYRDKTLDGKSIVDIGKEKEYEEMRLTHTEGHTRAYIKIQDGCNQFCSYCIIPYARGRVRSRREGDILEEVRGLAAKGYREIVLTGIHLSSYGLDFPDGESEAAGELPVDRENGAAGELPVGRENGAAGKFPLTGERREAGGRLLYLLRELDRIEGIARIRLGSLEPRIITRTFVEGLKEIKKLCRHFHLSLQSGCDETLARMNRHYTAGEYLEKVGMLREAFDRPAITTDVIVGFPGESDVEFETTRAFLETVNFYEMHIFQYSRRAGTVAAARKDQVPEDLKKRRSEILLALAEKQSEAFRRSYIGETVEVLFEEAKEADGTVYQVGYTGEYIRAARRTNENLSGKICAGKLSASDAVVDFRYFLE